MKNSIKVVFCFLILLCACLFVDFKLSINDISVDSHFYGTPSNSAFHDDNFYKCVVDAYNKKNETNLGYDVNLSDDQLETIKNLECDSRNINDVSGVEKLAGLLYLSLNYNQISNININNNVELIELYLYDNQISSIDLSNNVRLNKLNLSNNELASIDLSYNTVLEDLYLDYNQLTSINLSHNTALTSLSLAGNQFTGLDLSYITSLTFLSLGGNKFTNIDLSYNNLLKYLYMSDNQLTSIDLSFNTVLEDVILSDNQLSSIDLSHNIALTGLSLSGNRLTNIDLSHNTVLENVVLSDNQFSDINLSYNTVLEDLDLHRNQLTSIDLSSNTGLRSLNLSDNKLTGINLSSNTGLRNLYLEENVLTSIDLSHNILLEDLYLNNNRLTTIDLSHNTNLRVLRLFYNSFIDDKKIYLYSNCENKLNDLYNLSQIGDSIVLPSNLYYFLNEFSLPSDLPIGLNSVTIYYDSGSLSNNISVTYSVTVVKAISDEYFIDNDNSLIYIGSDSDYDTIVSNISLSDENVIGSINDGKYVVKYGDIVLKTFDFVTISSDKYDLSKNYLYGNIDDVISGIDYNSDILSIGLNLVNNKIEIKYGNNVLDSYDYINFTSSKYDLSGDSVSVSDDDISSFLSNINCTGCKAYVYDGNNNLTEGEFGDNYKLKIMYGNEVVKSFDIYFSVNSVSLNTNSVKLNMDNKNHFTLIAQVLPINAYNDDVIWESSDESVVSVQNGVIEALAYGEALITVRTVDGDFSDTCRVVVSDIITHTVSFKDGNNSYDIDFEDGENIVFKTDLEKKGYRLVGWSYNNNDYDFDDALVMPDHDIEMTAIWELVVPDVDKYVVSDGFISGISLNIDVSDFNLGIDSMYEVTITTNKDKLKTSGLVSTGDNINIYLDNELVVSYIVVVKGDINGDGISNVHDVSRLYKQIKGRINIDECYLRAGNVNGDTILNVHDVSKLYKFIKGRISHL